MFDNQILEERKTWRCALTLSESIQNLCDGRLEGLWGVSGLPPPPTCATETPRHSAGPLRWQKELKCQKKDRRRGGGEGRGGPPRRWGGARRSEAASANLIWWECIHAEEQEIPAGRQHCSAKTLKRQRDWGWPMVCDLKVEKAITENLKVGVARIVLH